MENTITGDRITVFADASLYAQEAVFKCVYWYGDRFHTAVTQVPGFYQIVLQPLQAMAADELTLYRQKLERDLVDFNLRAIVVKETQQVRELLIAKAFSHGEYDEVPPGSITDPVGFSIDV